MKAFRCIVGSLLAVLWVAPLRAQDTGTIRGRVTDAETRQPIPGVSISFGNRTALTQADGRYTLTALPAGTGTLRARMVGYGPMEQSVTLVPGVTAEVDLTMTAQAITLTEIVVVGYGEQRAGNITGAVTQLTPEEFNTGRIVNPVELIQAKAPGVQVVDNNEPGGGLTIRVRGPTSVNASSDPLYVIDGVPLGQGAGGGLSVAGRDPLSVINPNDIESITLLRDASAAAIYGANAANGVVLIQTRRGGTGRPQLEYSGTYSASAITRTPDILNASQFRTAVETYAPQNVAQLGNASTDWFDQVSQTAYGQEHNVALSGAGERMNWRLSLGYLEQEGIIGGTRTERTSLGLTYGQRLFAEDRLDLRANLRFARGVYDFTPGGVVSMATQMGPTQPVLDASNPTGFYEWPGNTLTSADNPVAILNLATDRGTNLRSIGNLRAEYRVPYLEGLRATVSLGYDVVRADRVSFEPSVMHSQIKFGTDGNFYRNNQSQTNQIVETYVNYAAPLNVLPGNVDVVAGYSYQEEHGEYPWTSAQGLSTDALGTDGIPAANTVTSGLFVEDYKLISFFGRLNYNINDRYLAAFSVRRDGSSRFGPGRAWGTFPSLSFAWRLSQEQFMRGLTWLSDLKVRVSRAATGNQAFGNYLYLSTFTVSDPQAQVQFGSTFVPTARPSAVDRDIHWEETHATNLGLDFGLWNERVTGSLDWYRKSTDDLIFTVPTAAGTTFSNYVTTNIGSMRNQGIELSLTARLREGRGSGLNWTATLNASHNSNELVSINPYAGSASAQQILVGGISGGVGSTIQVLLPGEPINSFFVYEHIRDANGNPIYEDRNGDGTINDQDLYVDQDGDGVITVNDRRPFHDPAPKWILGLSNYMSYGRWDVSFVARAYLGNYVYNNVASSNGFYNRLTEASPWNLHTSVLETDFVTPQYLSDYYVEDASFLRLDNIRVGYALNYRGRPMRVFATVQNAFTITGYSGVDPTAGLNGIDNNIYPRSRTFTAGLDVRF
jgi:iron complex outermembrane receptor protein